MTICSQIQAAYSTTHITDSQHVPACSREHKSAVPKRCGHYINTNASGSTGINLGFSILVFNVVCLGVSDLYNRNGTVRKFKDL